MFLLSSFSKNLLPPSDKPDTPRFESEGVGESFVPIASTGKERGRRGNIRITTSPSHPLLVQNLIDGSLSCVSRLDVVADEEDGWVCRTLSIPPLPFLDVEEEQEEEREEYETSIKGEPVLRSTRSRSIVRRCLCEEQTPTTIWFVRRQQEQLPHSFVD